MVYLGQGRLGRTFAKPLCGLTFVVLLNVMAHLATPAQAQQVQQVQGVSRAADEAALQGLVAEFTKAFNRGDARTLASLFTSNARIVTARGHAIEGRAEIEKQFADAFLANPGQAIQLKTESIRFLDENTALEEGIATVDSLEADDEGHTTTTTRYTAAYVKRNGKWLQDNIRDFAIPETPDTATAYDHLKELEWLVGEWVDESDDAVVHTTCEWSENRSYLVRAFRVRARGSEESTGTQRIGWDPRLKQIRSWVFDSEGGYSESFWSRDGERWVIKSSGYLKDGRPASATNILTQVSRDRALWASVDRTVGGKVLTDGEEIPLVRTPPQPQSTRPRTDSPAPARSQP